MLVSGGYTLKVLAAAAGWRVWVPGGSATGMVLSVAGRSAGAGPAGSAAASRVGLRAHVHLRLAWWRALLRPTTARRQTDHRSTAYRSRLAPSSQLDIGGITTARGQPEELAADVRSRPAPPTPPHRDRSSFEGEIAVSRRGRLCLG
ncbi:hypothetical protein HEK616_35410 [Streptomyces nigrescens]|uniref:Uncharacterized protein n=1 Tax=Streptomyces nigrescens TaxID=1920 RepID=A0ABM7ZUL9_STRNI|nr:hypothetical protein HEK616_35410 [Streptomyces nigrescens]